MVSCFQLFFLDGLMVSTLFADGADALRVAVADDEWAASAIGAAEETAGSAFVFVASLRSTGEAPVATRFLRFVFWDFGDHWGLGGWASSAARSGAKMPQSAHIPP